MTPFEEKSIEVFLFFYIGANQHADTLGNSGIKATPIETKTWPRWTWQRTSSAGAAMLKAGVSCPWKLSVKSPSKGSVPSWTVTTVTTVPGVSWFVSTTSASTAPV